MVWDGRNRRKFPRVLFPCLIKICGNEDAMLTHTENVSTGGVRVILKSSVAMGTAIEVEIDLMDTQEHFCSKGTVVWSEQRKSTETVKPNFFDIGVEFSGVNQVDQRRLALIIDHHLKQGSEI